MSSTQKVGALGEELVVKFLVKRGYRILDRNYRRPWGELDVVAKRNERIHFVEVKTKTAEIVSGETRKKVSSETTGDKRRAAITYIRSKIRKDAFRPEDNVNFNKMKRLGRIIQTYLMGKHVSDETSWQFDVATVFIDEKKRRAKIKLLEDIVL